MKIKYIDSGSIDSPLIMISETTPEECKSLMDLLYKLSKNELDEIQIHELAEYNSINEPQLTAKVGKRNLGVVQKNQNIFEWILKDVRWDNVAGLIEPFCQNSSDFQWLDETSEISVLLSPTGHW
jgi:hypothetical protein